MIVLALLIGSILWLLKYKFQDRFLRAYGLFFLILLVYASNKRGYGISDAMSEGAFSPLSLVRWACLILLFVVSMRMKKRPENFRRDVPLAAFGILLLADILFSATYAEDFNYSFYRGLSFAFLALSMLTGAVVYLHRAENCVRFFRFHYLVAWITLVPMLLLHLVGLNSLGVTIIMGQYAGLFGNQNMYGTFSALITPYIVFHWRVVAQTNREKWIDGALLMLMLLGLWYSRSRNGFVSSLVAVGTYFFVINLKSRLKIVAIAVCLAAVLAALPSVQSDFRDFVRKGSTQTEFGSQFVEEKRYAMWSGVFPLFWKEKLTGYGFASSHLLVHPFTRDETVGRAIHNSYLEIFGDLGLPGFICLMLILYRIGSKATMLVRLRGEFLERNINAVFISIFFAGLGNAFFESWMFSVGNLTSLIFWAPAAGVVARWAWRTAPASYRDQAVQLTQQRTHVEALVGQR